MVKLLTLIFGCLFFVLQEASAQQCTETGGYPWLVQSCLHSSDLNKIVSLNEGVSPPHNNNNQGALPGTLWLDTSTVPNTLRFCKSNPCFSYYVSTQWATWATVDPSTGLINFINQATNLSTRRVDTGLSDTITATDAVVAWYSASTAAKAEILPNCSSANLGESHIVGDGVGNAATYNIIISPLIGNTIGGSPTYLLRQNGQAVALVCNGVNDWTVYGGHNEIISTIITLNAHNVSLGGSLTLTQQDIDTLSLVTSTGIVNVTSTYTFWKPGSPAATTFNLPATPTARERHTLTNESNGSAPMTIAGNGSTLLTPGGSLTTYVLPNPGDRTEVIYIGSSQWAVQ